MGMKKICVVGNFGDKSNSSLNGQTVRSRSVYTAVKEYGGFVTDKVNTRNKLSMFKLLFYFIKDKTLIIMPAQRAIVPILFLALLIKKIRKNQIHLVVTFMFRRMN